MSKKQVADGCLIPIVLVAEDHQDIRHVTKLLLEQEGCSAIEAANGLEAFQAALSLKRLDLIFMDIDMPIMNGLEAARCLRHHDSTREVPIVAVTAHDHQFRQEAIDAGCNDFVEKLLMPEVLRDALAKYVNSGTNFRFLENSGPSIRRLGFKGTRSRL
jgi:two-component system, sensor histidine kinase and response regulator